MSVRPPNRFVVFPDGLIEHATRFAIKQAKNNSKRQARGRSHKDQVAHAFQGLLVEIYCAYSQNWLSHWHKQWNQAQVNGDDGGVDQPNGRGLKSIKPGNRFVSVSDNRCNEQDVYEVDLLNKKIRYRGSFKREDVEYIDYARCNGVPIEKLR